MLYDKVEATTRTFGIVAALMGSLAAALFAINPYDGYDANREPVDEPSLDRSTTEDEPRHRNDRLPPFSPLLPPRRRADHDFVEHVAFTQRVSETSLLLSWGVPRNRIDDVYVACCAGSFYCGVGTTVLSSVINAWLAATPPGGVRPFVRMHGWFIVAMPALLGVSTGLAGSALVIGLDRAHGAPVSYVGLVGTLVSAVRGVVAIAVADFRDVTSRCRRSFCHDSMM